MKNYTLLVLLLCFSAACTSVKNMSIMRDSMLETSLPPYPEFVIEVGDALLITITALDKETIEPFNIVTPYTVQTDGTIDLPILGTIKVEGKKLNEVKDIVLALVSKNVQKPFVSVAFSGISVSVLGEVRTPRRLEITKPISILEAIGAVEGLTKNARYDKVEVIRTQGNVMNKYILDLTSSDLVESPCYYLIKGDIVNILPLHSVLTK